MQRVTLLLAAGAALLTIALLAGTARSDKQGSVAGKVTIEKDGVKQKSAGNVVITIEDVPDGDAAPAVQEPTVRQKDKQFAPFLTVVPKGSAVEFPNDDKIHHNVFSVSRAKRFDLGLYKAGSTKSVKFSRKGVVDVYCNIHPEMVAKVKVVDTRYYAVTKKDGSFRIDNLPSGKYPIVAWQPYGEEYRGTVTVKAGKVTSVKIELEARDKPRRHMRKDGTPYGRYK